MRPIFFSIVCVLATSCGSASTNPPDASPLDANPNPPDSNPDAPDVASGAKPFIVTILLENHDYDEIVSKTPGDAAATNAPYINSLIKSYGLATNYKDTGHPSLPNYLHMISGDNQYPGVVDLDPMSKPYFPAVAANLGDQMATAGIKWRSYQEGDTNTPTTPCELSASGEYAPKHDPFLYFDDIQNRSGTSAFCQQVNVDYATNFASDLATSTYQYMWITPNLIHDGHDATTPQVGLTTSDTWVKDNLQQIFDSAAYKAGGVIFLTWDESEGRNGDDPDLIPMIVISNRIKTPGMTLSTAWTHSSYLATVEDMLGLARLATVTNEPTLLGFLN